MTETNLELHPWIPSSWEQFNPWKPWLWKRPMWIIFSAINLPILFYWEVRPYPLLSIGFFIVYVAVAVLGRSGILWFAREGSIRPDRITLSNGQIEFLGKERVLISMKLETLEAVEVTEGEVSFIGRDEKNFPTHIALRDGAYRAHSWLKIRRFAMELKAHLVFPKASSVP